MLTFTVSEPSDLDAVGQRWREFEASADCSFFQSWAWMGCLAAERFHDPVLLEARLHGQTVALALLNRRRRRWPGPRRLWLGESGSPSLDAVFTEHNGILIAAPPTSAACEAAVLRGCLQTLLRTGRAVTLSGISAMQQQAAQDCGAVVRSRQCRQAPYVDLATLRREGTSYLDSRSANTRQQLRRSARAYAAQGKLQVLRAPTAAAAHTFFEALGVLHQRTWTQRGRHGAWANADFVRFHHTLIDRAHEAGGIDLLCVKAGEQVIGYLYNLVRGGRVSAYQSGFDYATPSSHYRPGLTCHHLAIEQALAAGAHTYDFLAGEDRYKTSLATGSEPLWWLDIVRARSLLGAASMLAARLGASGGQ